MLNLVGKSVGRYHITDQLGEGGMATVYKGFDTLLERNIAIKVIRNESSSEPDFIKRFRREARALAQLDHPHILKVLDYGEQDDLPYLVMPFVQGGTLKQRLFARMGYKEAVVLLAPVARALEYAHKQGIIHRDVKPANILIDSSGAPLLSDFGIAKMLDTQEGTQLTATGIGIGTPDYMAPEQWLGQASPSTDIYSLGVVLYEMVTGRRPFVADTPAAVLLKHMNDPLPRPKTLTPDLPDMIEQIIFKALAKRPEDRYANMGLFAAALENISHENVGSAGSFSTPLNDPQKTSHGNHEARKKNTSLWYIFAILLVGIGIMTLICLVSGVIYYNNKALKTNIPPTAVNQGNGLSQSKNTMPPEDKGTAVGRTNKALETPAVTLTSQKTPQPTPFTSIEGLPSDIPVIPENNGDLIKSTQQGIVMYTFTTPLSMEEASNFYHARMVKNGWKILNTTEQTGKMIMLTFGKQDNQKPVNIITSTSENATWVTIQIMAE